VNIWFERPGLDEQRATWEDGQMGNHHKPPPEYWNRRDEIAAMAAGAGRPARRIEYTETEDATWRVVAEALQVAWRDHACAELLDARDRLALPAGRVPQLAEVSERLGRISGFEYRAVPGLVPVTEFFSSLASGVFLSTQYVRWEGSPLYTPEPDVIHELVGHANLLAHPDLAELHRLAGAAMTRLELERSRKFLADVFWFSVEFGVVAEPTASGPVWRAYGAGLLSSHGELGWFADHAEVRPLDIAEMGTTAYDIDVYQPVLFGGRSLGEVVDVVGGFFTTVTDHEVERLAHRAQVNG
jgi:phenylalanine-4-hydroxylase